MSSQFCFCFNLGGDVLADLFMALLVFLFQGLGGMCPDPEISGTTLKVTHHPLPTTNRSPRKE